MRPLVSALSLVVFTPFFSLAAGCGEDADAAWQDGYDEGYATGKAEIEDVQASVAALEAALEALQGDVAALQDADTEQDDRLDELAAGSVSQGDLDEVESALQAQLDTHTAGIAGAAEVIAQNAADIEDLQGRMGVVEGDCLTSAGLTGYATESWVSSQGYGAAADLASLDGRVGVVEGDYLTSADLTGYATESWVSSQGYGLGADVAALEILVDAIDRDHVTASDLLAYATESWVSSQGFGLAADVADLETRLGDVEGDYVVAADLDEVAHVVSTDTTVTVGTAAELTAALADLEGTLIASDATVTIALAAGTYTLSSPLSFSHPTGDRIAIEGAGVASTTLFFPSSDGLTVEGGATLGYVTDLTIQGTGTGTASGIVVTAASHLGLGTVGVEDFGDDCVYAGYASSILADDYGLTISGCGVEGLYADTNSLIEALGAEVSDCGAGGIYAAHGAVIKATYATVSDTDIAYQSSTGGLVSAYYSSATNSATTGYYAYKGSLTLARYSTSTGTPYAYRAGIWSFTDANNTTASGTSYDFSTEYNSFMTAAASTGTTLRTLANDTTDWIYGK